MLKPGEAMERLPMIALAVAALGLLAIMALLLVRSAEAFSLLIVGWSAVAIAVFKREMRPNIRGGHRAPAAPPRGRRIAPESARMVPARARKDNQAP